MLRSAFLTSACACLSSLAAASSIVRTGGSSLTPGGSVAVSSAGALLTPGSVIFSTNAAGQFGQNNGNFYWDDNNIRLGIGTGSPQTRFHVVGTPTARAIANVSPDKDLPGVAGTVTAELAIFASSYSSTNSSMLDFLAFSTGSANPLFRITNHWENPASSGTIAIGNNVGTTYTDILTISTNSRVGVNVMSPAYTLDVAGALRVSSAAFTLDGNAANVILDANSSNLQAGSQPFPRSTQAQLTTSTPIAAGVIRQGSYSPYDLFVATASAGAGQWQNMRTGNGP